MALGYFAGRAVGKATGSQPNIIVIWLLAVLPDVDLLFRRFVVHRGPTHSIIVAVIIFAPLLLAIPRRAAPYLAALATHSLIGDYITGGAQILWPLSTRWISYSYELPMGSAIEITSELVLFTMMMIALIASKDYRKILQIKKQHLTIIP